ncbi:hypothetical protein ACFLWW_04025, partial [Chloroflexota bacterium]
MPSHISDMSSIKKGRLIISLALAATFLWTAGCSAPLPSEADFNLIFKYGVMARNELDTFQGTYTKDMVADPPITVNLSLTEEELDRIHRKMLEIDFFNYPETFTVSVAQGEKVGIVTPYSSYYFK